MPAPKASVETWVNMVNEMQKAALSTRLGIPIIYGIDAVHGHNNVYKATVFPHNIGLGATRQVYFNRYKEKWLYFCFFFDFVILSYCYLVNLQIFGCSRN